MKKSYLIGYLRCFFLLAFLALLYDLFEVGIRHYRLFHWLSLCSLVCAVLLIWARNSFLNILAGMSGIVYSCVNLYFLFALVRMVSLFKAKEKEGVEVESNIGCSIGPIKVEGIPGICLCSGIYILCIVASVWLIMKNCREPREPEEES